MGPGEALGGGQGPGDLGTRHPDVAGPLVVGKGARTARPGQGLSHGEVRPCVLGVLGCRPGLASFKGPARNHPRPWSRSQAVPSPGPPWGTHGAVWRHFHYHHVGVLQVAAGRGCWIAYTQKAALPRGRPAVRPEGRVLGGSLLTALRKRGRASSFVQQINGAIHQKRMTHAAGRRRAGRTLSRASLPATETAAPNT